MSRGIDTIDTVFPTGSREATIIVSVRNGGSPARSRRRSAARSRAGRRAWATGWRRRDADGSPEGSTAADAWGDREVGVVGGDRRRGLVGHPGAAVVDRLEHLRRRVARVDGEAETTIEGSPDRDRERGDQRQGRASDDPRDQRDGPEPPRQQQQPWRTRRIPSTVGSNRRAAIEVTPSRRARSGSRAGPARGARGSAPTPSPATRCPRPGKIAVRRRRREAAGVRRRLGGEDIGRSISAALQTRIRPFGHRGWAERSVA